MRYLPLALLLWLAGCKAGDVYEKQMKDKNYSQTLTPPGTVNIGGGLYYDQTPVTNINWREYLYWLQQIYGGKSTEYLAALPDTLVWQDSGLQKDSCKCLKILSRNYLRHPKYANYPVVGITQPQAEAFAKWRSDRVMEFILLRHGVVKRLMFNKDSCFTIEKYYSGKFNNIKPTPDFSFYPDYRLPTTAEWGKAVKYDDSLSGKKGKNKERNLWLDIKPCHADILFATPTESDDMEKLSDKKRIYNLRDNVSQWTSEQGICEGGGWHDTLKAATVQDTFHRSKPNAWTGARYICTWKKWDGAR